MTVAERCSSRFRFIADSFWAGAYDRFVAKEGLSAIPSFSLKDVNGNERYLEEFLAKPTLLVFTSPHCGPCKSIYPVLRELDEDSEVGSMNLVLVSRGATRSNRALVEKYGLERITVLGGRQHVEKQLNVTATPWVMLIGPEARVFYSGVAHQTSLITLSHTARNRLMNAGGSR